MVTYSCQKVDEPDKSSINDIEFQTLIEQANGLKNQLPDSAIYLAKKAIIEAQKKGQEKVVADLMTLIGDVLYREGNYNLTVDYYLDALTIYQSLDEQSLMAETNLKLGRACSDALLFDASLKYLDKAYTYFSESNDTTHLVISLFNYGFSYEKSEETLRALEYYQKADSINSYIKNEALDIQITEAYASIFEDLGEFDKALMYYNEVLPKYEVNSYDQVDALNNVGDVYRKTGRYSEAVDYYNEAFEISSERNMTKKIEQNLKDLALTNEALGNYSDALLQYKQHMELYNQSYDLRSATHINQLEILYDLDQKNKQVELARSQAESQKFQRNAYLVGLIMSILVSILFWINLRQKNRINKILNKQNNKIQRQREELEKTHNELKKVFDELQNTQEHLIQSEKMASIGTLVAGIAHEINNPLNFVQGGVSILESHIEEQQPDKKEEYEPMLNAIQSGVDRLSKTIQSLNHFNRKSENMSESCDLHQIIDNCLTMMQHESKHRVEIETRFTNDEFDCNGNESNLHHAFINIIANGIQAIDGDGKLSIETKVNGDKIKIAFQDSGAGIDPKILPKIMDPFFTTKDPGKGTGLGLSITQRLILEHEGTIEFDTELGKGTTVTVYLPIERPSENELVGTNKKSEA